MIVWEETVLDKDDEEEGEGGGRRGRRKRDSPASVITTAAVKAAVTASATTCIMSRTPSIVLCVKWRRWVHAQRCMLVGTTSRTVPPPSAPAPRTVPTPRAPAAPRFLLCVSYV